MAVTREAVLAVVAYDEACTVSEIAERSCGRDAWAERTNVRNRLYELEAAGLVICDENRPQRWLRPDVEALVLAGHVYLGTGPTDVGYVGRCSCGWRSSEKRNRRSAQGAVAAHIGRA